MSARVSGLSIAGLDPSGGAGLLADIKTFEAFGIHGLGVCSALTFQNDNNVEGIKCLKTKEIISQIQPLEKRFTFNCLKFGIIESLETLYEVMLHFNFEKKIIWDPVFTSGSGFVFINQFQPDKLAACLGRCYLLTPNVPELHKIGEVLGVEGEKKIVSVILKYGCNAVLVKGGHREGNNVFDHLYTQHDSFIFQGERYEGYEKHGTGCILSAAITANLAKGNALFYACSEAKKYIHRYMLSSNDLIGVHYNMKFDNE